MNTVEFLRISSAVVPERIALSYEDRQETYQELNERVQRLSLPLADEERGIRFVASLPIGAHDDDTRRARQLSRHVYFFLVLRFSHLWWCEVDANTSRALIEARLQRLVAAAYIQQT